MKIPALIRPFVLLSTSALLGAIAGTALAAAAADAAAKPKTYTLFMGADIDVQVKKDYCRVRDIAGSSLVVTANGKEVSVPMDEGPISLQIKQSLKLTEASATIANLKGERAYTSANDPTKKFMRQQPGTSAQDTINMADGTALVVSNLVAAGGSVPMGGGAGGLGVNPDLKTVTENAAANAGMAQFSEQNNIGTYVSMMQSELAKELFDAMEVTFEVSSERSLNHPYVVIIARYREPDARPGKYRNWIFGKALAPVDRTPRKVRLTQGGFPPGFVMEDFKVHLYDRGQELATNVAERRVALTSDEAFQYVVIDYVSSHKGASLPPTPAMGKLPADFRTRLAGGQLPQKFFVKVSKDGQPVDAFVDEMCSQKVTDPYVQSVIMNIRFKPALDKGAAVDGIARVDLRDLSL